MNSTTLQELISGSVLLIDKPVDWTSFDVVNKIRQAIRKRGKLKKLKVGHAGTLDPFASGLLIICTGSKTKDIDQFMNLDKEYISVFELGKETDSYDLTGSIVNEIPTEAFDTNMIRNTITTKFLGDIEQEPPMFSAKKIEGKRLYQLARQGKTVERQKRPVRVSNFEILDYSHPDLTVQINCSKGTYIRSLAHDLGHALGTAAFCKTLQRSAIGSYRLEQALTLSEWLDRFERDNPTE
ncbi:MAG: tRNA pseudouridine(55) synthase TruB [Calditrichaeota bacterium]|nr:tRNA pseudouridine(55) synthase TruB [Calditrichota bacterium]